MRSLIAYDLKRPGRDYPNVHAALTSIGAKWAQGSVWLYDGQLLPYQIRDFLVRHIDQNDDLMVVEIAGHWATFRSAAASAWFSVRSWFGRLLSR